MMVEVNLSVSVIYLDQLLPIIIFVRGIVVLDGFEFIRKSSSEKEFVSSEGVEGSYFSHDESFVVFVDC